MISRELAKQAGIARGATRLVHPRLASALVILVLLSLMLGPGAALAQPAVPNACGDGRIDALLDDFDTTAGVIFKADPVAIANPTLSSAAGCRGTGLALGYDLTGVAPDGQSWVVLRRTLPAARDLSAFTHLRLALRGSNPNSHNAVDVKLRDSTGRLALVRLPSLADLPVWRPIYIDLRELSDPIDLASITDFEIGIVRCDAREPCEVPAEPQLPVPPQEYTGTLLLDELALVDLKPGGAHRLSQAGLEPVRPDPQVRAQAAAALLARVAPSGPGRGLIPAWFPEPTPTFNLYAQAEALLVFVYAYERTGDQAYRDAAQALAARLIELQIAPGKAQAGAWFTAYWPEGENLVPPGRALPRGQGIPCDGDETMTPDPDTGAPVATNLDACAWVGNVGWALIALSRLERSGFYDDPVALREALERGAAWVARQPQYRGNAAYPGLISLGIEGNISAYFGLLAAGRQEEAAQLGQAIVRFGWDPVQRRLRPGVGPTDYATALDVSGSWGVTFLRSMGMTREALDSQAFTASLLRTTSFDGAITGYGDIAGPYTVSVEFSAQAAAAGIGGANALMRQLDQLRITEGPFAGAYPGAADHWYGGQLRPWSTTMPGVSPTAWVYFANDRDPLREFIGDAFRLSLPLICA